MLNKKSLLFEISHKLSVFSVCIKNFSDGKTNICQGKNQYNVIKYPSCDQQVSSLEHRMIMRARNTNQKNSYWQIFCSCCLIWLYLLVKDLLSTGVVTAKKSQISSWQIPTSLPLIFPRCFVASLGWIGGFYITMQ